MLAERQFPVALLNGFLSFLLFAGALEVDFAELVARKWTILALAIFGTVLSTVLVAAALLAFRRAGYGHTARLVPGIWRVDLADRPGRGAAGAAAGSASRSRCRRSSPAKACSTTVSAVVLFSLLLSLATGADGEHGPFAIAGAFLLSAVGGGLLGLALGYVAFLMIRG